MIRPFTFLCLAAACGSGLFLYTEKHRAELLDRQIARTIHQTEAARQTTSLLQAEWGLLNNPDRLRPMAEKYLNLVPVQPSQWVQLSDLGDHLPPPVAPNQTGGTDDGAIASATPSPDSAAAPLNPVPSPANPGVDETPPPTAKPVLVAHATVPHANTREVAHLAPHHPVTVAEREEPLHSHALMRGAPLPLATPQPGGARVLSAMARPMRVARPMVVTAIPSALGVRTSVPAPVPLGTE